MAPTPPGGSSGGFSVGPYTLRWSDPLSYLVLWGLSTLLLLILAGVVPPLAIAMAAAILFGTLLGGTQLGK